MFGTQDTRIDDVVEALCTGGGDDVIEDVVCRDKKVQYVQGCIRMWSDIKDVADKLGDDVVSALCVWAS